MAKRFDSLGFKSSHAGPDIWMRPARKPNNDKYYEYTMSYVDNILAISVNARGILKGLCKDGGITYKEGEIKPPGMYLGARLQERIVGRTNQICWTISSHNYIKVTIVTVGELIKGKRWKLKSGNISSTPMSASYQNPN